MKSQTLCDADSRRKIYRIATVGFRTERGGVVASSDTSQQGSYLGEHKIACVGDMVRYPDGGESLIVSGAGDEYVIEGKSVALVGSHVANGDRIVSSLQTAEELMLDATAAPPSGFLQPGFMSSGTVRQA